MTDLKRDRNIDLASVELDYEGFRQLATNPNLSPHERIGFPNSYREGFESAIFDDILSKLPRLSRGENLTVLDVGPGCAGLPRRIIDLCAKQKHRLYLLDSEEMLAQLPDVEDVTFKLPGMFPKIAPKAHEVAGDVDILICYSVLHYIFVETNLFDVVDAVAGLLAPGGRALFADIPNQSKRRRFFASETGQRFHQEFTGGDTPVVVAFNTPTPGKIDDAVLTGLVQRAQAAGLDAYILPQPTELPMANRRDDLLLIRP